MKCVNLHQNVDKCNYFSYISYASTKIFMRIKLFYYKIPLQVLAPVILHIIDGKLILYLKRVLPSQRDQKLAS